ncbi:MAG: hypothetical protein WCS42_22435 [Verrucomicrobiota bacterium]
MSGKILWDDPTVPKTILVGGWTNQNATVHGGRQTSETFLCRVEFRALQVPGNNP